MTIFCLRPFVNPGPGSLLKPISGGLGKTLESSFIILDHIPVWVYQFPNVRVA